MSFQKSPLRLLIAVIAAASMAGCASFSQDGGFDAVRQSTSQRLGKDLSWVKSSADQDSVDKRVAELLSSPLTPDAAVQLALLNNKGLQASFAELGIGESDLVQAGRLPNPRFTMLRASHGDELTIDQSFTFNLFALLALPRASALEQRRFERTQSSVSMDAFNLAARTRSAYFLALAADETARYMQQVMRVAEAGAELARRMAQAGNFNKLQQAREQGFYADAALNLAKAAQAQTVARESLTRLLGLWGQQLSFKLPERLPDLPKAPNDLPDVEQLAMRQRVDVQAARIDVQSTAQSLGLTKTTRFINAFEFGPARVLEGKAGDPYKYGYELSFELPLFDWGTARVNKAEAIYMQAVNRAAETAINARSEVREAYSGYRSSYEIAHHYRDEIVPLRKRISDENQLRYNGMLIGVFDLLADARSQIAAVNGAIEALRDFWIAQSDLDMALIGKPVLGATPGAMRTAGAEAGGH